ncbi:MAG: 3-hydroxyacyl-ACP dehydratase FabZ [Acidobacteria bacterium]|nr:3-hydroxyacyl-ACP dehydratase FabZ [Acidobacteriota bacterium]
METIYESNDIMRMIPHRYPFLLVDRIVEIESKVRIVGIKNVTINEPFFQGHFPGTPVMPGVLVVEAMAQTAGMLVFHEMPRPEEKLMLFTGVDSARFRQPVFPGDVLRLELKVLKLKSRFIKLYGEALVNGCVAAEAEITLLLVDRSKICRDPALPAAEA